MSTMLLLAVFAANVDNYEAKLQEARQSKKNMCLIITSESCVPCWKLKTETFTDPQVKKAMTGMVTYSVVLETPEGQRVMKGFANATKIDRVPAYYVVEPKEHKILRKGFGFLAPKEFLKWMIGK